MLSDEYERIACTAINVDRDSRQRKQIEVDDLLDSIRARGVLVPIIVARDGLRLVAGERRLTASLQLGLPDIPVRFADELADEELRIIELEENLRRKDLPWRDFVAGLGDIHSRFKAKDASWTQADTCRQLAMLEFTFSRAMRVWRELDSPRLATAASLTQAWNILARQDERVGADALSSILEASIAVAETPPPVSVAGSSSQPVAATRGTSADGAVQPLLASTPAMSKSPAVAAAGAAELAQLSHSWPDSVLQQDFCSWAASYAGPKFNFIHCDFPYGVGVFAGGQANASQRFANDEYADDPEVYWKLLAALCSNLDRIMAQSGHLMFWFSMEHYSSTLAYFAANAPSLDLQRFPLVWHKSDNVGMLPDSRRGPRRTYETALLGSRGDRLIVKAVANSYAGATDREHHPSTKPEPMLRHFMTMLVDENTTMLDPTCGAGSALRAAESLGARAVLGLETNESYANAAKKTLHRARVLRRLSGGSRP
jgi:ParB-like chromosome segregation protein Spo0J